MERQLTEVERKQVESSREPGERTIHRLTHQCGIIKQKTPDAWLVWWGTADRRPVMTWEKPEDCLPYDDAVWPQNKEQGSPAGQMRTIDLRDPRPVRKPRAKKAIAPTKAATNGKRTKKAT